MENVSLLTTLSTGVLASLLLFFLFYRVFAWNNKLASLVTILLVLGVYIPLAVIYWDGIDVFAIHLAFFVTSAVGPGIITSQRSQRQALDKRLGRSSEKQGWFHWAPALIVGFFIVLAMVDATIITLANKGASSEFMARFLPKPQNTTSPVVSAFPGAVPHDYKEKYDQFNNYLAQLVTQRERGWSVANSGWQQQPAVGQPALFSIQVTDKAGQPVTGAEVQVSFLRAADKRMDKHFTLSESSQGAYGQNILLDAPGAWTVVLTIRRGEEVHEVKGKTEIAGAG